MNLQTLTIRPARKADLPALHELVESAYRGDTARGGWTHEADLLEDPRTSIDVLEGLLGHPDELHLIVLDGTNIVGSVQLTKVSVKIAYMGMLTVHPQRQSGGLGKWIIAAAENAALNHFGSEIMEMSVISQRLELIAYYQRRGYALTSELRPFPVRVEPPLFLAVLQKSISAVP